MKMYYQRQKVFTLESILSQISLFAEETGKMPTVIMLPVREYVYLPYLFGDGTQEIKTIHGIPVRMSNEKQSDRFTI